jgi:putative ABC transport system permease protein
MATMRAMGFSARIVLVSILFEAILLALVGAAIGIAIAYLAFDGRTISTLGGAVWDSQLVYSLIITRSLVVKATLIACIIGLLGGIFPAIRAARVSVADALRAT